ncbi:unnamed protein product [Sphagnum balticum]
MTRISPEIVDRAEEAIGKYTGWEESAQELAQIVLTAALSIPTQAELAQLDWAIKMEGPEWDKYSTVACLIRAAKLYRSLFTTDQKEDANE